MDNTAHVEIIIVRVRMAVPTFTRSSTASNCARVSSPNTSSTPAPVTPPPIGRPGATRRWPKPAPPWPIACASNTTIPPAPATSSAAGLLPPPHNPRGPGHHLHRWSTGPLFFFQHPALRPNTTPRWQVHPTTRPR